jgi:hypothetical protein
VVSCDHFRPPEHFSRTGRFLFRALCWISFIIVMTLVAYFAMPLVAEYVSAPLSKWAGDIVFGTKAVP